MKKLVLFFPFLLLALMAGAQDFQTEIALVEVPSFNGKTLAKAPVGKSRTLQLVRTKFSKSFENYTTLALHSVISSAIPRLDGTIPTSRYPRAFPPSMMENGH